MIEYYLIIISFTVGIKEDLRINAPKPVSLEQCLKAAEHAVEWFHQDFTNVKAECVPVNKPT